MEGERLEGERIIWKLFAVVLMTSDSSLDGVDENRAETPGVRDTLVQNQLADWSQGEMKGDKLHS